MDMWDFKNFVLLGRTVRAPTVCFSPSLNQESEHMHFVDTKAIIIADLHYLPMSLTWRTFGI